MPDAARYEALFSRGMAACLEAGNPQGIVSYVSLTQAAFSQLHVAMRAWGEYLLEELLSGQALLEGMLAAEEMSMARELFSHSFMGTALRDPLIASLFLARARRLSLLQPGDIHTAGACICCRC